MQAADVERVPLERARATAEIVRGVLSAACTRLVVAGSIRRLAPDVKDIELCAIPRMRLDLAGDVLDDDLEVLVPELVRDSWLRWRTRSDGQLLARGPKFYALVHRDSGMPIDLFVARPAAEWGAVLAIRTGPAEYSKKLVTLCKRRGLRCENNRLVRTDGTAIDTPEERQFIEACGLEWAEPQWRR